MSCEEDAFGPMTTVRLVLCLASCLHVFLESKRNPRIGHPWAHALMCFIVLWPLVYLLWLFWWPGKLRQAIFGSDKDRANNWAHKALNGASYPPPQPIAGKPGSG